jgi:murein DD-endopeptidase MepM/ murein hydrolase activator NlpD
VTSPFGYDAGRRHPGIDIGILRSLAVRSAERGRVVAVGQRYGYEGYGNVVQVAVGDGFTALYAHLAGWRVRVGQMVEAGQRIGTAGCTGWCSGTHLHFELRFHGRPVDPLRFRQNSGALESAASASDPAASPRRPRCGRTAAARPRTGSVTGSCTHRGGPRPRARRR